MSNGRSGAVSLRASSSEYDRLAVLSDLIKGEDDEELEVVAPANRPATLKQMVTAGLISGVEAARLSYSEVRDLCSDYTRGEAGTLIGESRKARSGCGAPKPAKAPPPTLPLVEEQPSATAHPNVTVCDDDGEDLPYKWTDIGDDGSGARVWCLEVTVREVTATGEATVWLYFEKQKENDNG